MIIYGAILSPYVRKVLMFAGEKGIAVEQKPGGMGQGGDEFAEASPFGKMPALRDTGAGEGGGDYLLSDSSAICAYIDAKHADVPLIPAEARARGRVIWFDEFADTILMGAGAKIFFNRVVAPHFLKRPGDSALADRTEAEDLPPILRWLDSILAGRAYLVGDALSLADISVAVMFNNLNHVSDAFNAVRYPELARWYAAVSSRPSLAVHNARMDKVMMRTRGEAG